MQPVVVTTEVMTLLHPPMAGEPEGVQVAPAQRNTV